MATTKAGDYLWLSCEVKRGQFSNERLVRLQSDFGDWVGWVPQSELREEKGNMEVRALVLEVQNDRLMAQLPGDPLGPSVFQRRLAA